MSHSHARLPIILLAILSLLLSTNSATSHPITSRTAAAPQATYEVRLPFIRADPPAFNPSVNGFNFANYGGLGYARLTSLEMRRLFGPQVCISAVQPDGSCTLASPAIMWMQWANDSMRPGLCEGLAALSLLLYTHQLTVQDFGAAQTIDLALEGNTKLQHEIAYWFATAMANRAATIKSSPNAVVAALRADFSTKGYAFGTLRFSMPDGAGGHAVVPISLTDRPNQQVAIGVYDVNYPRETRELLVDTSANTWFYSPDPTLTEDDYRGDAQTQRLGFAPLAPRMTVQACTFCPPSQAPRLENSVASDDPFTSDVVVMKQSDNMFDSFPGAKGTTIFCDNASGVPLKVDMAFPSSNLPAVLGQPARPSWKNSPEPYYSLPPNDTYNIDLLPSAQQTGGITASLLYLGHGFDFEIGNLLTRAGAADHLQIAPGGTVITYTTEMGEVPDLTIGFVTPTADFNLVLHSFELEPTDFVILDIDVPHNLVKVSTDTISASNATNFGLEMDRSDATSSQIFKSTPDGIALANDQTFLIDYSTWTGDGQPLRVGYDDNHNGLLDDSEVFMITDVP